MKFGKIFGSDKNKNSEFWIPKDVQQAFNKDAIKKGIEGASKEDAHFGHILQLAEIKRAIKNFVQILTNKSIPVTYLDNNRGGFTDGKTVYISGDIDKDLNFDKTVGLSLHEASHIALSNIEELKAIQFNDVAERIFNTVQAVRESFKKHVRNTKDSTFSKEKINFELYAIELKNLLNWVEDRRVDAYIQKDSPGYVGYYETLYDEFFNTEEIKQLIYSPKSRQPIFQNYMFHVINLISKYSDENALCGLKEIKDLIDIKNILRLKSMQDSFKMAQKIFEIILKNIDLSLQQKKEKEAKALAEMLEKLQKKAKKNKRSNMKGNPQQEASGQQLPMDQNNEEQDEDQNDDAQDGQGNDNKDKDGDAQDGQGNDNKDKDGQDKDDTDEKKSSKENGDKSSEDKKNAKKKAKSEVEKAKEQAAKKAEEDRKKAGKYADADAKTIKDAIAKSAKNVEKLLNHEIEKQTLPSGVTEKVTALSGMNVRVKPIVMQHPTLGSIKTRVVVIPELTMALIKQRLLPITRDYQMNGQALEDGIKLGKKLVKKIKIRNESRNLMTPRQKTGRLQQRTLSDLAYDSENVFYRLTSEEFKDMHFHISVDASGSMSGRRWTETIKLLTAITYAACKIKNIDVVVDFRSQLSAGNRMNPTSQTAFPFVLTAFNSIHQSFKAFTELISHVTADGLTPEGMCFQAQLDEYVPSSHLKDSIFINLSDGYPGCDVQYDMGNGIGHTHYNSFGINHTARIVKKIRKMKIEVISYFISGGWTADFGYFKDMYGRDAKQINTNNVTDIAKSINEKLLKK